MIDDAQLLRRYVSEQAENAFTEVVQRHLNLVFGTAVRQLGGDRHLAEDVTQNVFALLARKAPALIAHPSLAGWLYTCVRHTIRDMRQAERSRRVREREAQTMHELMSNDGAHADWKRLRPVLDDAMKKLNAVDREAVLLRYFEDRPFAEIGHALRLTEDAARMRVNRALDSLRERLEHNGVVSTASALATVLSAQPVVAVPAGFAGTVASAALAGASAPAVLVGAPAWLAFMTTSPKGFVGATVVALILATVSFQQTRKRQEMETATTALRQRAVALEQDTRIADERQRSLEGNVASPTSTTPAVAPVRRPPVNEALEIEKMRLFFAMDWKQKCNRAFALLEKAGASPAQRDLFAAMAEEELPTSRFSATVSAGISINRYTSELATEWEAKTRGILGDAIFERLKKLQPAQTATLQLADYLSSLEIPFDGAKASQLLDVLADHEPALLDGGRVVPDEILARAHPILSPQQMAAWRRLNSVTELRRKMTAQLEKTP